MLDNAIIKNSIKKLIFKNLANIFTDNIIFIGGICDFLYTNISLDKITDIDIMIPYSYKDIFIHKLLFDDFIIKKNSSKHKYKIKLYKAYLANLKKEKQTYQNNSSFSLKYRYCLNILGINLDIFLYSYNLRYSKSFWHNPISSLKEDEKNMCYNMDNILIENPSCRINKLKLSSLPKHKTRLEHYNNSKPNETFMKKKLDSIIEFTLPEDFLLENYKKYNIDLHNKFVYNDTYFSHYIQYGINQNRKYV